MLSCQHQSMHIRMYAHMYVHRCSVHHVATLVERSLVKKTSEMIFPRPSPAAPASSGLTMWYSWSLSSWRKSGLMAVALLLAIMVPMVSTEWGGGVGGACITFTALQYNCIAYNVSVQCTVQYTLHTYVCRCTLHSVLIQNLCTYLRTYVRNYVHD